MPSPPEYKAALLADRQLDALKSRLLLAAERMSDDQLLEVTDALHDVLRERRRLRGRFTGRLHGRLEAVDLTI